MAAMCGPACRQEGFMSERSQNPERGPESKGEEISPRPKELSDADKRKLGSAALKGAGVKK